MIAEIDRSLERWLRAALPLPAGTGDLQFDQPERSWDARRSIPLVSLYLYSVHRSASRAAAGSRVVPADRGLARERLVPVVESRYLVSVWGGGPGVEHELLGRLVDLLAQTTTLPDAHLSDALRAVRPRPTISIAPDESTSITGLWAGLDVPPRPSVQLLVYSPLSLPLPVAAADPPSSVQLGFARVTRPAAYLPRRRVLARPGDGPARRRATVSLQDSARPGVGDDDRTAIEFPLPGGAEVDRG